MNDLNKIDKILAEFMGEVFDYNHQYTNNIEMYCRKDGVSFVAKRYTQSMDMLTPVLKKLRNKSLKFYGRDSDPMWTCSLGYGWVVSGSTMPEAVARAAACVIRDGETLNKRTLSETSKI